MYSVLLKIVSVYFLLWNGSFNDVMAMECEDYDTYDCTYAPTTVAPTTFRPTGPTTPIPVEDATPAPSVSNIPSFNPSSIASLEPSLSSAPSDKPSGEPSAGPSDVISDSPSSKPSGLMSMKPTGVPSGEPSAGPSDAISDSPSKEPSEVPSMKPSGVPSSMPSAGPSDAISSSPSEEPSLSNEPTKLTATDEPSSKPSLSIVPTPRASEVPSVSPSEFPSEKPSRAPESSNVENQSVYPAGTTEADVEDGLESRILDLVNADGQGRNLREGRSLEAGTCQITVAATEFACPLTVLDRSKVCYDVVTIIQEPQRNAADPDNCDVNVGAKLVGDGLENREIIEIGTAGEVIPGSVIITLATEQPSSQPSGAPSGKPSAGPTAAVSGAPSVSSPPSFMPSTSAAPTREISQFPSDAPSTSSAPSDVPTLVFSAEPSLSLAPTTEFNCIDDDEWTVKINERRRERSVNGCRLVTNHPKRCNKGSRAKIFRVKCPASCMVPRCTCIDKKKVTFKLGERRFTKHCSKLKPRLCARSAKIRNSCPNRCDEPRCVDNNPQIPPEY